MYCYITAHQIVSITLALLLCLCHTLGQQQAQAMATASTVTATAGAAATVTATAAATATATASTASAATTFGSKQLYRCRQSCYRQFSRDWHYCTEVTDCRNCWHSCQQQLLPFMLRIHAAQRQGALVLTDIGWDELIANASRQCLITWEVSGGGLMGNLLTDTARAELSLWPDTVYNIQVTCKHKLTGLMRRSMKLNVDTHQLIASNDTRRGTVTVVTVKTISTSQSSTPMATPLPKAKLASDKVYIITALPTAAELSGVVYPAFGALAFFIGLLILFLFLRPQRKRFDADADTAALLDGNSCRRLSDMDTSSILHV